MKTKILPYTLRARIDFEDGLIKIRDHKSDISTITVDAPGSKVRVTKRLEENNQDVNIRTRAFLSPQEADKLGRTLQQYAQFARENEDQSTDSD